MKKFILNGTILITLVFTSVLAFNYIADYNSAFRPDIETINSYPELLGWTNFNNMLFKSFVRQKGEFDSILFGSSRVGNIDVKKIPGGKFFNLWSPAGIPQMWLRNIQQILNRGIRLKKIIVIVDDFSYLHDLNKQYEKSKFYWPHPDTLQEKIKFYSAYLFVLPTTKSVQKLLGIRNTKESVVFMEKNGAGQWLSYNKKVEADPEKHINSDVFKQPEQSVLWPHTPVTPLLISVVTKIKSICEKNNIELTVIMNPAHKTSYLADTESHFEDFLDYKRKLANIVPYYDFTGLNSINTNNLYYCDTLHYRTIVGDMMIARIYGTEDPCPADFGVYVTKENVEAHLAAQKKEFLEYKGKDK